MITLDLRSLLKRLNSYCTRSLEAAAGICVSRADYEIGIEHFLLTLMEEKDRDVHLVLQHFEIDPARVERTVHRIIARGRTGNPSKPVFAPLLIEWLQDAWLLGSVELELAEVRSGVLLAGLAANPNRYLETSLRDELASLSAETLRVRFGDITAGSKEDTVRMEKASAASSDDGQPREETALGRFTVDFTGEARAGKTDPVFCRDREIRQMIDILGRRRKNNPIAVGEAGVGKTAVVEGLALKVVEGDVPEVLIGVEILGLDMGLLQAGAGVKGEFENRLKAVIEEVKASPKPIILFIDEAHTLIGAGGPSGGGDAANLLKPALARGELRTIAATTWTEYKKYFEKDPALARRFQLVKLDEPSPNDTVTIIRGLSSKYAEAHGVYIRDDAVQAAANLAARYVSGRRLPDKAVDVLDTAAARVKIALTAKPDRLDDQERRSQNLRRELAALERDVAAGIRSDERRIEGLNAEIAQLDSEIKQLANRWEQERGLTQTLLHAREDLREARARTSAEVQTPVEGNTDTPSTADLSVFERAVDEARQALENYQEGEPLIHHEVNPDVVGKVISDWTGIPVRKMVKDEARSILDFRTAVEHRIKGQATALEAIDQGMRTAKAGLRNPNAPIGVFLFVGPSGVGKTETATAVADLLFGGERFMTAINMSEFQEKHTVSRLIGSPPGYVGYGEGGILTEAVRQRPYSIVLLDEVEKADLEVMNLFYQVFDKGVLSDGEGRVIDFKNTVLFLTSNLGSDIITELASADQPPIMDTIVNAIRPVLSHHFQPALLARMEIVPFLPISTETMREIVDIKLERFGERLRESHQMDLTWQPTVREQIVQRCTEVETGARNIDYIVNRNLIPKVATQILEEIGAESAPVGLDIGIGKDGDFMLDFRLA